MCPPGDSIVDEMRIPRIFAKIKISEYIMEIFTVSFLENFIAKLYIHCIF